MKNLLAFCVQLAIYSALPSYAAQCSLKEATSIRIEPDVDKITTANGARSVKIYGVDVGDGRGVPLHAGPIEIFDREGHSICSAQIELLKPPFMFANDRYFYFLRGDAIDVAVKVIDMNNCKLAWQSRTYTWDHAPRLASDSIFLSGGKLMVAANCLPAPLPSLRSRRKSSN
jgi:hypothetical protein